MADERKKKSDQTSSSDHQMTSSLSSSSTLNEENNRKCLELALEGERLCKNGDFQGGIAFFEAAVKEGTQDMRTLSAIYSQLGNAYFYLNKYDQALRYHKLDLAIARTMRDRVGEGKASGNLGNTYKMLGRYDEAIECCKTHLNISRELKDQIGEGRALYNLGNVYHTKGKQLARVGVHADPGQLPDSIKSCLQKAVTFYEKNLALMTELGDKSSQGRACGNLGNTHYLLGNFNQAIVYHQERLKIAQEFGDLAAERRAQCNLGNANVFLGEFEKAIQNYEETLRLGQEMSDKVIEAQACFSLGNCYTLIHNYEKSLEYHLKHLMIAQQLNDRHGEARACWSIGNNLSALNRHTEALEYAEKHKLISIEINDTNGIETADGMIHNIQRVMNETSTTGHHQHNVVGTPITSSTSGSKIKRFSMDNMELLKLTPGLNPDGHDEASSSNFQLNLLPDNEPQKQEFSRNNNSKNNVSNTMLKQTSETSTTSSKGTTSSSGDFLDMIASFQKDRMEDQRCQVDTSSAIPTTDHHTVNKENNNPRTGMKSRPVKAPRHPLNRSVSNPGYPPEDDPVIRHPHPNLGPIVSGDEPPSERKDELLDLIAGLQSGRMEDQRATLPAGRPATNGPESIGNVVHRHTFGPGNHNNNHPPSRRIPPANVSSTYHHPSSSSSSTAAGRSRQMSVGAHAIPDDDFFDMLMRCQGSRLEDQRSQLPGGGVGGGTSTAPCPLKRSSQCAMSTSGHNSPPHGASSSSVARSTVPDDDFFSLIVRFQAGRIDDQRTCLPSGQVPGLSTLSSTSSVSTTAASSKTSSSSSAQSTSSKPVKSGRRSFYKSKK